MKKTTFLKISLLTVLLSLFQPVFLARSAGKEEIASMELEKLDGINDLLNKAERNLENDDYEAAIELYTRAIHKGIDDPVALASVLVSRGMAYSQNGQMDEAISDYSEAIARDPFASEAYTFRGQAYQYQGNYDNAIGDFNKVIKQDPATGYALRAQAYLQQRDFERAIDDFSAIINDDLGTAYGYTHRGVAYKNNGQFQQAVADLTKAIEINEAEKSDSLYVAELYIHRAESYFALREYEKASGDVETARSLGGRINPGFLSQLQAQMKEME